MKQYQTDKAEREAGSIDSMEAVNQAELARVTEPEFQYEAEAFETHQQQAEKTMIKDNAKKCACKKVKRADREKVLLKRTETGSEVW